VATMCAKARNLLQQTDSSIERDFHRRKFWKRPAPKSTAETVAALDLSEENVKVRLHRGRALLRAWLFQRVGAKAKDAFPFMVERCDRVVKNVFDRLARA